MQRYMTVKYTSLLLILLTLFSCLHYFFINPLLECLILNNLARQCIQTLSLFIIGPVICVLIMVFFINHKEEELYDSIS